MTLEQFYVLRPVIEAIIDANIERLDAMTDEGKVAFHQAVERILLPAYESGLRGDALVDHVNTMLGG